jgi:hypothetical protein
MLKLIEVIIGSMCGFTGFLIFIYNIDTSFKLSRKTEGRLIAATFFLAALNTVLLSSIPWATVMLIWLAAGIAHFKVGDKSKQEKNIQLANKIILFVSKVRWWHG